MAKDDEQTSPPSPTGDDIAAVLDGGAPSLAGPPLLDKPYQEPPGDELSPKPKTEPAPDARFGEDLRTAQERIAQLEERLTETRRSHDQAHYQASQSQSAIDRLLAARQHELEAARAAQAYAMPAVENPEELADDPAKLVEYMQQLARWSQQTTLGYVHPFANDYAQNRELLGNMLMVMTEYALDRGERDVDRLFPGAKDYGEYRKKIRDRAMASGKVGVDQLLDSGGAAKYYALLKMEAGEPIAAARSKPEVPSDGGVRPSVRQVNDAATDPAIASLWRETAVAMGIPEEADKPPTKDRLRELGVA